SDFNGDGGFDLFISAYAEPPNGKTYMYYGTSYVSVDEITIEDGFSIYPNPSNGTFTIETPNSPARAGLLGLEITDIFGKVILTMETTEHAPLPLPLQIDISQTTEHAPLQGIYFLNIKTENGIITKKIVIQ
ncbi:MAG: hypothetical protein B6D61_12590, partial [Bacteroidetes bacterium 4484_249]